jgi:hypothetical protein
MFEGIKGDIPEPPNSFDLQDDLFDYLLTPWREFIDPFASSLSRFDQSGPRQQARVFADSRPAYGETVGENTRPAWILGEPKQQFASAGIGQHREGLIESRRHRRHVTIGLRIRQGCILAIVNAAGLFGDAAVPEDENGGVAR